MDVNVSKDAMGEVICHKQHSACENARQPYTLRRFTFNTMVAVNFLKKIYGFCGRLIKLLSAVVASIDGVELSCLSRELLEELN